MLMIKTRTSLLPEVTDFVVRNHPYQVAEVISTEVLDFVEGRVLIVADSCFCCLFHFFAHSLFTDTVCSSTVAVDRTLTGFGVPLAMLLPL
jgi:hypothetical protein